MSVGLKHPSSLKTVKGVRLAVTSANIYANKRDDLLLVELIEGTITSAVFTKNLFCAAPVKVAKKNIDETAPRYLLINAGNANAGTGEKGFLNCNKTCQSLADVTNTNQNQILPFSTGVIGEDLPVENIINVLPEVFNNLSDDAWLEAAKAIMTTDTIPKAISTSVDIDGEDITITGIAKGAGMIKPNMATMLAFIGMDANIEKSALDSILKESVEASFNRITIDGDTSTNDACVLFSTCTATNKKIDINNKAFSEIKKAVSKVLCYLAQAIVRDGEGATKFISIEVSEGKDTQECLSVAYKIAHSPLVKTAFTASDPNWGRILASIGNAGLQDMDINKINIYLDDVCIVKNGERANTYTEEDGKKVMLKEEIKLSVKLNRGSIKETIWTTDLSHDYVTINAEYRT
jgi:glutamate N-acetyltransferase / amino-acid N-acetyltransferase